eukprot:SM000417S15269  [mRNA]  locus=s417:4629:5717:- [translate_table: standard]
MAPLLQGGGGRRAAAPEHVVVAVHISQEGQSSLLWALNKCAPGDTVTILHVVEHLPGHAPTGGPDASAHVPNFSSRASMAEVEMRPVDAVGADELASYKEQIGRSCAALLFVFRKICEAKRITAHVQVAHGFDARRAIVTESMLVGATRLVIGDVSM